MFTIGDIRNIAIQIEENGEKTYRSAAARVKDRHLREMLIWLADEERRHAEWFAALQATTPLSREQQELEAMGKTLLQDIVRDNTFALSEDELVEATSIHELLLRAKALEDDTVLFYEFLHGFIDESETCRQLEEIIEQERNHALQLELLANPLGMASPHIVGEQEVVEDCSEVK